MSEERYILRKPARIVSTQDGEWCRVYLNDNDDIFQEDVVREYVDDVFVRVEDIKPQIREQIEPLIIEACEVTSYKVRLPGKKPFPEYIDYEDMVLPLIERAVDGVLAVLFENPKEDE